MDQHKYRKSGKRLFSEAEQSGGSSKETKRVQLSTEWETPCPVPIRTLDRKNEKRSFGEFAKETENLPEIPSKRMRMSTDEGVQTPCPRPIPRVQRTTPDVVQENIETAHASAVHPGQRVKSKKWSLNRELYKMTPITEEAVEQQQIPPKKIWIIGSSYIQRGEKAAQQLFGKNFGLNAEVEFLGKGGMRWSGVLPRFYSTLSTQTPPDILVVHAGGNDLGLEPAEQLAAKMTAGLIHLRREFPSMGIVFSCINPRRAWRYGHQKKIDDDRKMVNELVVKDVGRLGGDVVEHPLLKFCIRKLYLPDGVHFTQEGNWRFLSAIHKVLKKNLL